MITSEEYKEHYKPLSEGEELVILEQAIKVYGPTAQLRKLVEECAECIASVMQYYEFGKCSLDDVASELADVEVTLKQATLIVNREAGENLVDNYKQVKLRRLKNKMNLIETVEEY